MLFAFAPLLTLSCAAVVPGPAKVPTVQSMRKARDPNIAVQEELCLARRAGTVAAYDLFITRHPRHALTPIARGERDALSRTKRKR